MTDLNYTRETSTVDEITIDQCVILTAKYAKHLPHAEEKVLSKRKTLTRSLDAYTAANHYYVFLEDTDAQERATNLFPPCTYSAESLTRTNNEFYAFSERGAQLSYLNQRPVSFLILGKPGIGQRDLGKMLAEYWKCVYIHPESLIEEEIESGSRTGQCIEFNLRCGRAIGVDIILRLVEKRTKSKTARHRGFVICGFPLVANDLYQEDPVSSESAVFNVHEIFEDILDATVEIGHPPEVQVQVSKTSHFVDNEEIEGEGDEKNPEEAAPELEPIIEAPPIPKEPVDVGSTTDNICVQPDISLNYEEQINFLFSLMEQPFLTIYVTCPNADVTRRRDNYRFNKATNKVLYLESNLNNNAIYTMFSKEPFNDWEVPEDFMFGVQENVDVDYRHLEYLIKLPRDFTATVSAQLEYYRFGTMQPMERHILLNDPAYFIKVDGRISPTHMFNSLKLKLKTLPLQRVLIPQKFNLKEEVVGGEGDVPPIDIDLEGITPLDFFNKFKSRDIVNKMFKYSMSDWGTVCPVSMKEGTYLNGDPNFAVHFMNKVFFLSDEEAYKKFVRNPRPYLTLPYPKPRCRIAVMGPKYSGKSSIAKCLSYLLEAEILNPEQLKKDFVFEKRTKYIEACRSDAINQIMAKMESEYYHNQKKLKFDRIYDLVVRYASVAERLRQYYFTSDEISAFPIKLFASSMDIETLKMHVHEMESEFHKYGLMKLFNNLDLCKECVEDKDELIKYLPDHYRQTLRDYVPPDVFDPQIVEFADKAVKNIDLEHIELTPDDHINLIKSAIKNAEDTNEARGNNRDGWIIDGLLPEYDFINELGPQFIDDVFLLVDDSNDFKLLVERFRDRLPYNFEEYRQLFLDKECINAAFRVPTRSTESCRRFMAHSIINEIIDDMKDDDESVPGEFEEEFAEKIEESRFAKFVRPSAIAAFQEEIRNFYKLTEPVLTLFKDNGVTVNVLDVNKHSLKELLLQVIHIYQQKYAQIPTVVTPEDRVQELEDFSEPAVDTGAGEEGGEGEEKDIQEDLFFERRRYGDTSMYCPVTFHDYFVLWKGKEDLAVKYEDKLYFFSNENNMNKFLKSPDDYLVKTRAPDAVPPPRICLVGVGGSGKTLIGKALARNLGLYYVNFENLVIAHLRRNKTLRRKYFSLHSMDYAAVQNYLTTGEALPDSVLECLLPLWFKKPKNKVGFILDGFPRRPSDVDYILRNCIIPDIIIEMDVAIEIATERIRASKMEAWQKRLIEEREYKLKLYHVDFEQWEKDRKAKFDELMEEKRQERYANKLEEQIPTIPEGNEDEELLKTAVSLKSIEEDTDALEVNRYLDQTMPEPEYIENQETYDEANARITNNANAFYDRDLGFLRTIRDLIDGELIPWIVVNANGPIDCVFSQIMRHADKIKFRNNSLFERCYDVPLDVAENLLNQGYYFLSPYGRTCPVQYHENLNPIQLYIPFSEQSKLFPLIYRQYIYFLAGKANRDKFKKDPLLYTRNEDLDIKLSLIPFRMAIIGPPCSGKTTICKRLAREFGFKYVSPGLAVRYVLDYIPNSTLAKKVDNILRKGWELTPELMMKCVEASCLDGRSNAQGCIYDGFPCQRHEVYYLAASALLPHVVVDLQATHDDVKLFQRDLKEGRYLPPLSYNYVEHRYAEWNKTASNFRKYLQDEYGILYEQSVHPSIWGCWTGAFNTSCKVFKKIKKYYDEVFYDTYLDLEEMLVCPLEYLERQCRFKNYCPLCLYKDGKLNCNLEGLHKGMVQYKSYFYWLCDKHFDYFGEDPDKFLISIGNFTLPENLPEELTPEEYDLLRSGQLPNLCSDGYCVVCFRNKGALNGTVEGLYELAIKYKNMIYLFDSLHCLKQFRATPENYCYIVVERQESDSPYSFGTNNLPIVGFLEQYQANILVKAITNCATLRPIIPGLSEARSAAICVGLYLKCNNINTSQLSLKYYQEARDRMLNRHLCLVDYLTRFKDNINPFIYYEDPIGPLDEPEWYVSAFATKEIEDHDDAKSTMSMKSIIDDILYRMHFD